ncbi:MAG TPA: N-acetylmuramic acid 6-phosphate etherase [Aridibacter sp.]|nr:N-acetylmuramic acid 6-phosphate etherase [Aridibacter sp.]
MSKNTENRNPVSRDIDRVSTEEALRIINAEDRTVADTVAEAIPEIASVVEECTARFSAGGRLIYVGAGTSGRLGVLDASEIPPTFGIEPGRVVGVIAGGPEALVSAVEGAEDSVKAAPEDLGEIRLAQKDVVVCLSASGETPYTVAAAELARSLGCFIAAVTSNRDSRLASEVDTAIVVETGPEVIAGSTRLKAGTAQKLVLNMISTMVMVRLGYTTGNVMTNLWVANEKLRQRAESILGAELGLPSSEAATLLESCGGDLRVAIVSGRTGCGGDDARAALLKTSFVINRAVDLVRSAK